MDFIREVNPVINVHLIKDGIGKALVSDPEVAREGKNCGSNFVGKLGYWEHKVANVDYVLLEIKHVGLYLDRVVFH